MSAGQRPRGARLAPPLRVAFVWNGALLGEELLETPRPVVLGPGARALFPLPEGAAGEDELALLDVHEGVYRLHLSAGLGGDVWLSGVRQSVRALASGDSRLELGPDDYGVVTVGPVALFFQHVRPARPLPRSWFDLDGGVLAGVGLALFLVTALGILSVLDARERPEPEPLELPADLVARYMVVPPPEAPPDPSDARVVGQDVEDPGLLERDEQGGRVKAGDEGRAGEAARVSAPPELEGERREIVERVRSLGLLGALAEGGRGNAIAEALEAPSVSDLLGGLGSTRTALAGTGGGGEGAQGLFTAGDLGTGPAGAGVGAAAEPRRGPGARRREEARVEVQGGRPTTRGGFLSAEQIDRVVRANQAAVRYCYELEVQRQPGLEGRVVVQWRIDLEGHVSTARIASSTLRNDRVHGCITRQVKRWRFPKPDGGELIVEYPFVLRSG